MSDEKDYVTKEVLNLSIENATLTITKNINDLLDVKFTDLSDRFDKANIERRDSAVKEVTGFEWKDREKAMKAIQHAHTRRKDSNDTKRKIKHVVIGASALGVYTWVTSQFKFPWTP